MDVRKLFVLILLFFSNFLFCQTKGEKLFKENKPTEAITQLQKEIDEGNVTSQTYNYLGLSYFQIQEYQKAISSFQQGLSSSLSNKKLLYFNQGNVYFATGDYEKAESCYTLSVAASTDFYKALLNRANARCSLQKYNLALEDYKKYLEVLPEDPQAENISKVIAYLSEIIEEEEAEKERIYQENLRQQQENERIQQEIERREALARKEAEERRLMEEERRRRLLEEVQSSLQQTDTTSVSSGAEDVIDYDYESELD